MLATNGKRVTFTSGPDDGTGVAALVTGADPCELGRVTRKVPYLLPSPLMVGALRPVEDCGTASRGKRNEDTVGAGSSTSE